MSTPSLTHIGADGQANMVDVGDKAETVRIAVAEGFVRCGRRRSMILKGNAKKGDVLGTARLAGIMAAKQTSQSHPALPSADAVQGFGGDIR
jgi:cyclic pyranopterin phosphate synthase